MLKTEVRTGAYYDSVILMQLQRGLVALDGVAEAGVVMGTPANKDVLAQGGLLTDEAQAAGGDDLIIVVGGDDGAALDAALARVDELLTRRRGANAGDDYRPKSLDAATKALPDAHWVLISVPGRYAAGVADEALRLGKHVFLYSDNVGLDDEIRLKQTAAAKGLMVMGPDCGTAIVNGVGLGFANAVRAGNIGLVGASGTGLQHVTARIHQLGGGITHALGTGGRDLSGAVGAVTARQALDLLSRDPATEVIVLISKPPAPEVARSLLQAAQATGKPVVVNFIGFVPDVTMAAHGGDNLHFVRTLDATAQTAVELAKGPPPAKSGSFSPPPPQAQAGFLRGLYSGGTLAYEALLILQEYLPEVYSNAPLDKRWTLAKATRSQGHTVVDLGEDEFTVGRLHPMMDNDLRLQRLAQEAADPETGIILLDVVLGHGAHPDPAAELGPGIAKAIAEAKRTGRDLEVVAVVVGTDADPQVMDAQIEQLRAAGAETYVNHEEAVRAVGRRLQTSATPAAAADAPDHGAPVAISAIHAPLAAVNVGLESFTESLQAQDAAVIHVDWRPPAGGNERLAGILARMKSGG